MTSALGAFELLLGFAGDAFGVVLVLGGDALVPLALGLFLVGKILLALLLPLASFGFAAVLALLGFAFEACGFGVGSSPVSSSELSAP